VHPDVRVVHGSPDDEELAALMAVLSAVAERTSRAARAGGVRSRRAHWDGAFGDRLQPTGSWRVRDRTVTSFDPGAR
jgi:hypothetical protein